MKKIKRISNLSIFLSIFCFFHLHAQTIFNPGQIKADSNFNCDFYTGINWDTSIARIGKLCNSKNKMEIRLRIGYPPHGGEELIILTFNNEKWEATKYKSHHGWLGYIYDFTSIEKTLNSKDFNERVNVIFDTLKANNIFLLPNIGEFNLYNIYDGARFRLSFKVDDKFRSYVFISPSTYIKEYPNIPELRNYIKIVEALRSLFE